uniref:USP domain-containing protein n=1 Tax=viral metagenome TaxID=1070528 RepID=A0A6C0H4N2_9ZZZZ
MKSNTRKFKKKFLESLKTPNITRRRSFSPSLNKHLYVRSLKTLRPRSIKLCDGLLNLRITKDGASYCEPYNSSSVKEIMLHNLKSSKHLDVSRFIPPIQLLSNCWFNTMFVSFFFSDKGRKFFRFFRELMITGKKLDSTLIPSNIAKLFFILNLFIEASYNQTTKSQELFKTINVLTKKLNTNFFIYHIYQIINNKPNSINIDLLFSNNDKLYDIPNIKDAGNPLSYYEAILKFLNYDTLKLMKQVFTSKSNVEEVIKKKFQSLINVIPDIIIIEDFQSKSLFETSYKIVTTQKEVINYVLDSIIITNKDHFDPKANSHFVSLLTVNSQEYKFDGSSLSKLERFNWKKLINTNKNWKFKENPNYKPELYNFTKGYKIMFYYRS